MGVLTLNATKTRHPEQHTGVVAGATSVTHVLTWARYRPSPFSKSNSDTCPAVRITGWKRLRRAGHGHDCHSEDAGSGLARNSLLLSSQWSPSSLHHSHPGLIMPVAGCTLSSYFDRMCVSPHPRESSVAGRDHTLRATVLAVSGPSTPTVHLATQASLPAPCSPLHRCGHTSESCRGMKGERYAQHRAVPKGGVPFHPCRPSRRWNEM